MTRSLQPIEPMDGHRVRMYTCGPTVYRYAHVGNLRSYLLADLIRRAILYHGTPVLHVKNITDVGHLRDDQFDRGEDRMLVQAGLESRSSAEIADAYEAAFHADEARVNILPAHVFPRATEHIAEMVALAEALEDAGHAYATAVGNVYYAVASFDGYGRLSGNSLDRLRAGHRGEVEPDKRDPADFALWRAAGPNRDLRWSTERWGPGFPGWHLECSAMARRYLGDRFDLHTGGIDNIFPHHEDEIAQSAPIVGGPPARVWVHGEHLLMAGRKMAKSAGNFQRVTDLAERDIDPLAFRYLVMTSRHGRKLNYSDTSIDAAASALRSLRAALRRLGPPPPDGPWSRPIPMQASPAGDRPVGISDAIGGFGGGDIPLADRAHQPAAPLSGPGVVLHDRMVDALDDDLDTPALLAIVRETLRSDLSAEERRWLVLDVDAVLGLSLGDVWSTRDPVTPDASGSIDVPADVATRLAARSAARDVRDFARADAIRDELGAEGWDVVDDPGGSRAIRRSARGSAGPDANRIDR
jgi:cysteinyl-tRNA synthetase